MNTFDDNANLQAQAYEDLKRRVSELEEAKRQLKTQIDEIRCDFHEPCDNLSVFTGFTLSSFSIEEGMEKEYSAWCRGQFRFAVTQENDQISQVEVDLTEDSVFREIENDLKSLCQERCPNSVLMAIEQYAYMNCFRKRVFIVFLRSKFFRFYEPETKDGSRASNVCKIRAYRVGARREVIMELSWTIAMNDNHYLAHNFTILHKDELDPFVQQFTSTLESKTFHSCNQEILWEEWREFCQSIANYDKSSR